MSFGFTFGELENASIAGRVWHDRNNNGVIDGEAELWLGDERENVKTGQSVLIPAGHWHGFRNVLSTTLHVRATLAAAIFEASYDDRAELSRRFLPEGIRRPT